MTVLINGEILSAVPSTVKEMFYKYSSLVAEASKFVHKPQLRVNSSIHTLYVTQKEYAVISQSESQFSAVGSDDATTCHIVIIHNKMHKLFSLAHIDSARNVEALTRVLADTIGSSEVDDNITLDLYVIGGYMDERCTSEMLTLKLLQFYHEIPLKIKLCLFCVGELNTQVKNGVNWPIIYGTSVSFNEECFSVHPATFSISTRGPSLPLRSSRFLGNVDTIFR